MRNRKSGYVCPMLAGSLAFSLCLADVALAAPTELKYRMFTHDVTMNEQKVGEETQYAATAKGFVIFEDGRVATKEYVYSGADGASAGTFTGRSTYIFENGDTLSATFTGGWDASSAGGDYTVVGGTGSLAGVTGTGHFDILGEKLGSATAYTGNFILDIPSN